MLSNKTVKELRELAKERDILNYSRMTKETLVNALTCGRKKRSKSRRRPRSPARQMSRSPARRSPVPEVRRSRIPIRRRPSPIVRNPSPIVYSGSPIVYSGSPTVYRTVSQQPGVRNPSLSVYRTASEADCMNWSKERLRAEMSKTGVSRYKPISQICSEIDSALLQ
jgi:Rho termination factor, N-terminal domain